MDQKQFAGVRIPAASIARPSDTESRVGSRIVSADCGGTRVYSVYVPNGRSLDNEFYAVKLAWLAQLRTPLDELCPPR